MFRNMEYSTDPNEWADEKPDEESSDEPAEEPAYDEPAEEPVYDEPAEEPVENGYQDDAPPEPYEAPYDGDDSDGGMI